MIADQRGNGIKRRIKNISRKSCGIDGLDSTNLSFESRRSIKSRYIHNGMKGIVISKWIDAKIDIRHQCRYATCVEEIYSMTRIMSRKIDKFLQIKHVKERKKL